MKSQATYMAGYGMDSVIQEAASEDENTTHEHINTSSSLSRLSTANKDISADVRPNIV